MRTCACGARATVILRWRATGREEPCCGRHATARLAREPVKEVTIRPPGDALAALAGKP